MIISRGRGYIFVHIPKTGGTAFALAMEARAKADDILIGDTPKAVKRRQRLKGVKTRGRLWKHSRLADIEGLVVREDFETLFTLTLVRNPWDRVVSYYHWLQGQGFDHPAVGLAKTLGFADFVAHPHTRASLHSAPYGSYMTDSTGVEHCDLFVRIEEFAADIAPFENHLGFKLDLPVANTSARDRDWRTYYDENTARIVSQVCAVDIARFGYVYC